MVPDPVLEDGTMWQNHESTNIQSPATPGEAASAVQGGLAYLADVSGEATPYGFQHLLGRADWEGRRRL